MNPSDFSSVPLFGSSSTQDSESVALFDLAQLAPSSEKSGVGGSWQDKTVNQQIINQTAIASTVVNDEVEELLMRSPSPTQSLTPLATTHSSNAIDPLGFTAETLLNSAANAAPSSTPYPGYILRYSPGFPLEQRSAVAQWQQQMRNRGWSIIVDGFYGAQSERVARQFQQEKGLAVDGVVGKQTWKAVFDNSTITGVETPDLTSDSSRLSPSPYPGSPLSYQPTRPLSFNPQVRAFQQRLQALGWQIEADGLFGPRSEAATRLIQQQNNLTVDGIVGPLTWAAIFSEQAPLAPTEQNLNPASQTNRINAAGLELIKSFEGLRLNSYLDAVGVWTIGYGHTRTAGPSQSISYAQATELLRSDVATFEKAVAESVRVPITANQFAALVSFAYNVGSGALRSSTLLRRLNAGDTYGAANEFLRWNRAGGQVLYGLTRRREAERALFLS